MRKQETALAVLLLFVSPLFFGASCSKDHNHSSSSEPVPNIYTKLYGTSNVHVDGEFVVIDASGIPDHKSPYFKNTKWQDSMYEAYNGSNPDFFAAMGQIVQEDYTFRIPLHPTAAATKQATPLGPIGVSLNGVPFFNQYNGQRQALTVEVNTFDEYKGHPTPNGQYHYHVEPLYLTAMKGKDAFLGFLLDGFPVYGPKEGDSTITDADLDACHGHFGVTKEYPNGIYHYHITPEDPYINGNGFYGTPGTVTQ